MHAILAAMEIEMEQDRPGSAGILARLADVIAALIIRGWVECGCDNASGGDHRAARSSPCTGIGRTASRPRTGLGRRMMAGLMGASRSMFSERFVDVLGVSPLRYLTDLRMRVAAQLLEQESTSVTSVAYRVGYSSQAAFTRAFKRVIGTSPAAHRRSAAH